MSKTLTRLIAPALIAASMLFGTVALADNLTATGTSPLANDLSIGPTQPAVQAEPARAFLVDYVIFARNLFLIGVVYFSMRFINDAPKKRKKSGEPAKGVGGKLFLAMLCLLAMQALSFWLYTKEAGPPGRNHKTVPLGRDYFVY